MVERPKKNTEQQNQQQELQKKDIDDKLKQEKEKLSQQVAEGFDKELGIFATMLSFSIDRDKLKSILIDDKLTGNIEEDKKMLKKTLFPDVEFGKSSFFDWLGSKIKKGAYTLLNWSYDIVKILYDKQKQINEQLKHTREDLEKLQEDVEDNNSNSGGSESQGGEENGENQNGEPEEGGDDGQESEESDTNEENTETNEENTDNTAIVGATGAGVAVVGGTTAGGLAIRNRIDKIEKIKKVEKMGGYEKMIDKQINQIKKQLERKGFEGQVGGRKELLENTINELEKGKKTLKQLGKTNVLGQFEKLQSNGVLSLEEFNKLKVSDKVADKILEIANDPDQIKQLKTAIASENKKTIKTLIGLSEGEKLSDNLFGVLKKTVAQGDEMIKATGLVFKETKLLKLGGRFLRRIPFLDIAALGFDIWQFKGEDEEAQLMEKRNKVKAKTRHNRANTRLRIGLIGGGSEILAGILAASAMGGPVGILVGLGVGAVVQSAQYTVDAMYYDVKAFYEQNTADFLNGRKIRTELKQTIISASQGAMDDVEKSINETRFYKVDKNDATAVVHRAFEAMIITEENMSWDEKKGELIATDETKKHFKNRMDYIKKRITDDKIKTGFKNGDLILPGKIVSESKVYDKMLNDEAYQGTKENSFESISAYNKKLGEDLKSNKNYNFIKKMPKKEFFWIYKLVKDADYTGNLNNAKIMQDNQKFIKDYYDYISFGLAREELFVEDGFTGSNAENQMIEVFLMQDPIVKNIEAQVNYSENELASNFIKGNTDLFDNYNLDNVSSDPGQNIMYEMARQIHGYNKQELLAYFSKAGKGNALGLYFGGNLGGFGEEEWRINNDWNIDISFSPKKLIDKKTNIDEQIIKWISSDSNELIRRLAFVRKNKNKFEGKTDENKKFVEEYYKNLMTEVGIDTSTETADKSLNFSFRLKFRNIVLGEREYLKNKDKHKEEIITYIKNAQKNGSDGYITLPYYLQVEAKKSGLGDCSGCFFKYEEATKKIILATNEANKSVNIEFVDVKNIIERPYDKLNQTEKDVWDEQFGQYFSFVDKSANRLGKLLSLRDGNQDELDMPEEYERIFRDKILERDEFKESLKDYDIDTARKMIEGKYKSYQKEFENLYINIQTKIHTNIFGDDIDSSGTINYLLNSNSRVKIDNGNFVIEGVNDKRMDLFLFDFWDIEDKQYLKFQEMVKKDININGKTINLMKLLKEDKHDEALWYANQLRKSIVEVGNGIDAKENGIFEKVWVYNSHLKEIYNKVGGDEKKMYYENILYNFKENPYVKLKFDETKLENLEKTSKKDFSDLELVQMTNEEKVVVESGESIDVDITETNSDKYVWGSERGRIKFTLNPPQVESWDLATKFEKDGNKVTIGGIEFTIPSENLKQEDIKEIGYIGNLINFCKKHFKGKGNGDSPFNVSMIEGNIEFNSKENWFVDTTVLELSDNKEKYPILVGNKDNIKRLVDYLNGLGGWE